ncbi:hypothetical protein C8J57DRAFT_1502637 [Mycena rebaudengoi]|nr:hypothetical protein C8J57DRAFT_1502637 [Mycena rebaudengoi]
MSDILEWVHITIHQGRNFQLFFRRWPVRTRARFLSVLTNPQAESPDDTDEAAAAKLWAVYISEAEKYDKALVESWKSDMGGMLIFAGLFSASLTAFLIESYKTLSPDSADTTVLLLSQISLRLAASANGSTFSVDPSTSPFTPPTTSLVCNALWFVSLGLSLSSALIATLLDQWARDFLHRSEMRSAPVVRARIFSYLYYGLKRFNMHAVVEVIPLLLHASLLLFLAGLVAFLLPVNRIIMGVAAGLLALLILVYCTLTILPILYLDCPYRTPLSSACWRLLSTLRQTLGLAATDRTPTVVEAMVKAATGISDERTNRDHRALIWTVKSLADDTELEPFIESIPDVLWGSNGRRGLYDHHIDKLIHDPDTLLLSRIGRLLLGADSGLLPLEARTRREITCFKALWAIAPSSTHLDFSLSLLHGRTGEPSIEHYAVSARYHLRCSIFRSIDNRMGEIIADFNRCQAQLLRGQFPSIAGPLESLVELERTHFTHISTLSYDPSCFDKKFNAESQPPSDIPGFQLYLENAVASIQRCRAESPRLIFLQYLKVAGSLSKPPFEFERTQDAIRSLPHFALSNPWAPSFSVLWEDVLNTFIDSLQARSDVSEEWTDKILGMMLSLWVPDTDGSIIIPEGLVNYLNRRKSPPSFSHVSRNLDSALFLPAMTNSLSSPYATASFKHNCLTALWYYIQEPHPDSSNHEVASEKYDRTLDAVLSLPLSPASLSVTALLKSTILGQLVNTLYWRNHERGISESTLLAYSDHPLLPQETMTQLPAWFAEATDDAIISQSQYEPLAEILFQRTTEGRFVLLTEFLEFCNTSDLPFKTTETLEYIGFFLGIEPNGFHVKQQIRFASSVQNAFERDHPDELFYGIIKLGVWWGEAIRWLNDPSSRQMIRDSFAAYVEKYPSDGPSNVRERVQDINSNSDEDSGGTKLAELVSHEVHLVEVPALVYAREGKRRFQCRDYQARVNITL